MKPMVGMLFARRISFQRVTIAANTGALADVPDSLKYSRHSKVINDRVKNRCQYKPCEQPIQVYEVIRSVRCHIRIASPSGVEVPKWGIRLRVGLE